MQKDSVLSFGQKYAECLIAAEVVARGTGPIKFLNPREKANPVIFDMAFISENELPEIWKHPLITEARKFALMPIGERRGSFERDYAHVRKLVWGKFGHLFDDAMIIASEIEDPLIRRIRQEELESLEYNFRFSAHKLGMRSEPIDFKMFQYAVTGLYSSGAKNTLENMAGRLSKKLAQHGFKGTLQEQIKQMEESLGGYLPKDQVLPHYREMMDKIVGRANEMLGSSGFSLEMKIEELPEYEKKTGYMAYDGRGKALTYIRPSNTTTRHRTCLNATHEMTHLLDAALIEKYFLKTGDFFGAFVTMCTSSVCRAEGLGEHGTRVYSEVVRNQFKDAPWALEILELHAKLKLGAIHQACREFYRKTLKPFDPKQLQDELKDFYLKYGIDEKTADTLSTWPNVPDRENKNVLYSPFYGIGRTIVSEAFAAFPNFDTALQHYSKATRERGPLTIRSLKTAIIG